MDISYYKKYEPIFGAWTISHKIGEGSFGAVFEIERHDMGGDYKSALKAITIPQNQSEIESAEADGLGRQGATDYFRDIAEEIASEFVLMSKLKGNSNIVSYEDHQMIEHEDGIGWDILIRMELLSPLLKYIKENTLTKKDVIQMGIDICKALELCQKYNIIHRDIKPENIFVSPSGDFKLGDFGIARTMDKTTGLMSKKGTYTYMAPEVYCGSAYGSSVDIYSLGIVLYRLLNDNRTPFLPDYPASVTHNDREDALSRRMGGAPLPQPKNADGRLAEIVLKACAYKPQERYSSPQLMRQELEAILYSRDEEFIIYPSGGEVPIKSVEYIKTGNTPPEVQRVDGDKTERISGGNQSIGTEKNKKAQSNAPKEKKKCSKNKVLAEGKKGRPKAIIAAAMVLAAAIAGFAILKAVQAGKGNRYDALLQEASSEYTTDFEDAKTDLNEAMKLFPDKPEAYRQYAYALYLNGKYDECVSFGTANANRLDDDQLKLILASALFETGDYANAADYYYAVSENDKNNLSVENLRDYAVCLGRMDRLDEAAAVFVMLTDKGATADVTDYVLGETYYDKNDYANAEATFKKALSETKDDALTRRIYISLAETYRDAKEYDKSISIINQALETTQLQNNTVLWEMLGAAYYGKAEAQGGAAVYKNAAQSFEKVISLGVQKDYFYVDIYAAYVKAGEYSMAEQALKDMEKAFPKLYTPHALLATLMIMEENAKGQDSRDYSAAYAEYQTAQSMVTSEDDQTQMQQLEGLISQLKSGGWLN